MRKIAHERWPGMDELPAGAARATTEITDDVTRELGGAKWAHVGWAVFFLASQLQLNAEGWVSRTKPAIPRRQMVSGVQEGGTYAIRAGDALISRGQEAGPGDDGSAFIAGERLVRARPALVGGARAALESMMPSTEDTDKMISAIRETDGEPDGASVVGRTMQSLPGLDRQQAGWGLIVSGSSILGLSGEAAAEPAEAAPQPAPSRRWGLRRKPKQDAGRGAEVLGFALIGAVFVITGDDLAR